MRSIIVWQMQHANEEIHHTLERSRYSMRVFRENLGPMVYDRRTARAKLKIDPTGSKSQKLKARAPTENFLFLYLDPIQFEPVVIHSQKWEPKKPLLTVTQKLNTHHSFPFVEYSRFSIKLWEHFTWNTGLKLPITPQNEGNSVTWEQLTFSRVSQVPVKMRYAKLLSNT